METTVEQTENIAEMATPKRRTTKSKTRSAKSRVFKSKTLPKPRKRRK